MTKTAQVHKCGNSVSPYHSAALVRAQVGESGGNYQPAGQMDLFGGAGG